MSFAAENINENPFLNGLLSSVAEWQKYYCSAGRGEPTFLKLLFFPTMSCVVVLWHFEEALLPLPGYNRVSDYWFWNWPATSCFCPPFLQQRLPGEWLERSCQTPEEELCSQYFDCSPPQHIHLVFNIFNILFLIGNWNSTRRGEKLIAINRDYI